MHNRKPWLLDAIDQLGRQRRRANVRSELYFRCVFPWWGRLGIWLKRAGCRMVIGRGHYLVGEQPYADEGVLACKSCGAYVQRDGTVR